MTEPSAHEDTFARDNLPPPEQLPPLDLSRLPETAAYPARLNWAAELLDKRAAEHGERPAYHFGDETWSYADLLDKANRVAEVLVEDLRLVPGNRVLIRGPNNPMYVASWLGAQKAGAVVVATMPLLRARELGFIRAKAKVEFALCDHRLKNELEKTRALSYGLEHVLYYGGGDGASLEARMASKSGAFETIDTAADDVALILFTSGTTGPPKGCMHFHRDVLAICDTVSRYVFKPGAGDVFTGSPPLAFAYGFAALLAFPLHAGASAVLVERFVPETLLEAIERHEGSLLFTAPVAYRAMTGLAANYDLSSLETCVSAGETLPLATYKEWERATGLKVIDAIGSTEMLNMFIASAGDDLRPGSTGKPVPGYEARVLGEDGTPLPPGVIGKLAVRGPTGCRYLDNPERQTAYVRHGWNLTGDSFKTDEDGYFWYQARSDDMIVSSGYNISGPEIEGVMLEHPWVLECAVIGVADNARGQIVKAFVVLRDGHEGGDGLAAELQEHVKAAIAPYKYPRAIQFMDSLPKTQTGKLQRFKLREKEA